MVTNSSVMTTTAGFSSGTYDSSNGTWEVTDHDAHAWVEVWFRGYGWLPFDPTPGRGSLSAPYTVDQHELYITVSIGIVTYCRQARAWQDAGLPPLRIAINVSAVELRAKDFVQGCKRS